MNEFTQKVIGTPDYKKEKEINRIYEEICLQASSTLWDLEFFFNQPETIELSVFFDFLKCSDPRFFLLSKYIEYHDIKLPGLNVTKIIEMGLVDVPADKLKGLINSRSELLLQIEKTKSVNFYFPLIKLFDPKARGFAISSQNVEVNSQEFDNKVFKHCRILTCSEKENKVIEAFEKAIDALNGLIEVGAIQNHIIKWKNAGLVNLSRAIIFEENSKTPLRLNPSIKRLNLFSNLFDGRNQNERIVRFCDIFTV